MVQGKPLTVVVSFVLFVVLSLIKNKLCLMLSQDNDSQLKMLGWIVSAYLCLFYLTISFLCYIILVHRRYVTWLCGVWRKWWILKPRISNLAGKMFSQCSILQQLIWMKESLSSPSRQLVCFILVFFISCLSMMPWRNYQKNMILKPFKCDTHH